MKNRKTGNLIISIILHTFLLTVIYIFQGAIFPYLRLGGLVPPLLPVVTTGVALYEGRDTGGIFGLFAGMLCDLTFNQPIGTFTVLLTLIGILVGALSDTVILSSFATYLISCTAALIVCSLVQMMPVIVTQSNVQTGVIIRTAALQTLYALILGIPIWFAVRALGRRAERISPSGKIY